MCQNTYFWSNLEKMLKIFWFILKVVNIKFRNTCRIFMIWHFFKIFKKLELKLLENSKCTASYLGYYKIAGLQPTIFSGTPWNWGIHISGYWKIAGLRPAIFRGTAGNWSIHNSGYWKIAGLRPAIFRGTLGNWGHS